MTSSSRRFFRNEIRRNYLQQAVGFDDETTNYMKKKYDDCLKVKKDAIAIEFCGMKKVHLEDLSSLRSFSSGDIVEWLSLENVVINHCPKIKKFGLGMTKESQLKSILITDPPIELAYLFELLDDKFSMITEYNVCKDEELSKIIRNPQSSHFTNLKIFRAKDCNGRLEDFLGILVRRSQNLQVINIEQCNRIGSGFSIFDFLDNTEKEVGDGKYFKQLKELKITKVYETAYIWFINIPEKIDLGNLQILHIKDVPSVSVIFNRYPPDKLPQLKELIIEKCEKLYIIFHAGFAEVSPRTNFPSLSKVEFKSLQRLRQIYNGHMEFSSLKSLIIEKCPILTKFTTGLADPNQTLTTDGKSFFELNEIVFDSYNNLVCVISTETLQELKNLKKLIVSHCKELKIIFNIHQVISSSTQLLPQLCELALNDLPKLTRIVNQEIFKLYENLKILQVKQCKSLDLLQVPQKLTNLEICDCEVLDKIVVIEEEYEKQEEEEGRRNKFMFCELEDVSLENLSKLSVAFSSIYEFPFLRKLNIANCSAMKSFVKDSKAHTESSTVNYFFPNSLLVGKLNELHIINIDVENLWHYNYPFESFCELENLRLANNKKLLNAISSGVIMNFKNLKKLSLNKCELLREVFDLEDDNLDNETYEILPQLGVLSLISLTKLKCVWNKEPQVSFFPNLVALYIVHCGNLQSLFSLSLIKNIGKLKILKLCKCDKIEDVISSDVSEDKNVCIMFPELECLVMKDLPMFVNFYKQSRTLYCPKLKTIRMDNIPKMKTFSGGIVVAPVLRSVYVTFVKKLWWRSSYITISHMQG